MTAPIIKDLPYNNNSPISILSYSKKLNGKTFRKILNEDPNLSQEEKIEIQRMSDSEDSKKSKGSLGHFIEEYFFYYNKNSNKEADFSEAGVELKVSPYIKNSKGLRAKERLVLDIINYEEDYNKTFEESPMYKKCKLMLLIYYFYEKNKFKLDYLINYIDLFQFPLKDLIIIKSDYDTIIQKIREGKAHELSEGDTRYLGACTKGVNSKTMRKQHNSNVLAKQRAFCLKNSYMTVVLNEYLAKGIHTYQNEIIIDDKLQKLRGKIETYGNAIDNIDSLKKIGFEETILNKIRPFYGRKADDLFKEFGLSLNSKSSYNLLAKKMLGIDKDKIEEFEKANIKIKAIRLKANGVPKEAMSFPTFKYLELSEQDYYDSDLYEFFSESKFLFMIFKFTDKKESEIIFEKAMFWHTPGEDLEGKIKIAWNDTKDKIIRGEYNNFMKISDDMIIHVRPHARNAADTFPTPQGGTATKKCFWLNQKYIKEQIEKGGN